MTTVAIEEAFAVAGASLACPRPGGDATALKAAQAAIEAEAEREFQARYDDQQHWMLAGMSEYYGSEGFDRPPSDVYSSFGGFVFDERFLMRDLETRSLT